MSAIVVALKKETANENRHHDYRDPVRCVRTASGEHLSFTRRGGDRSGFGEMIKMQIPIGVILFRGQVLPVINEVHFREIANGIPKDENFAYANIDPARWVLLFGSSMSKFPDMPK